MGFKPVDLRSTDGPIRSAHSGKSFALPPTRIAKSSAQHGQNTDTATDGDRFNLGNLSNDFEVHQEALCLTCLQDSRDV
jgi:hypothetical protein